MNLRNGLNGTRSIRVNISVSADLRRRMLRHADRANVNWSAIATVAFEQEMAGGKYTDANELPAGTEGADCRP